MSELWGPLYIPLSKEKFIEISEKLKGKVVAKYYEGDEDIKDFPSTLEAYNKLISNKNNT